MVPKGMPSEPTHMLWVVLALLLPWLGWSQVVIEQVMFVWMVYFEGLQIEKIEQHCLSLPHGL